MSATAEAVRERPILFSGPMVRAILDGCKTQTRRVILPQPADYVEAMRDVPSTCLWWPAQIVNGDLGTMYERVGHEPPSWRCPYGYAGDLLWVRETWCYDGSPHGYLYRADYPDEVWQDVRGWRPSIHMPRDVSRLTLRVTDVRVERVQAIGIADIEREGIDCGPWPKSRAPAKSARERFRDLWDSINAKRGYGWDANPWVWVISFGRVSTQPGGAA